MLDKIKKKVKTEVYDLGHYPLTHQLMITKILFLFIYLLDIYLLGSIFYLIISELILQSIYEGIIFIFIY